MILISNDFVILLSIMHGSESAVMRDVFQNWHKGCFRCEVCTMTLNMKNYKGYDKKPYCTA